MREFFNGWRRKVGVVTLVLACVLVGEWARSYRREDALRLGDGNETSFIVFRATQNGITCERYVAVRGVIFHYSPGWYHYTIQNGFRFGGDEGIVPEGSAPSFGGTLVERDIWKWECCGFEIQERGFEFGESIEQDKYRLIKWTLPWWSIVLPLTLLSAFLLIAKPRKAKQCQSPTPKS